MVLKKAWKHTWLTGGFALLLLSGSVVTAVGRPIEPILLQASSPLTLQSENLTKWNSDFSAFKTESLHNHFFASELLTAPSDSVALTPQMMALASSLFQAEPLMSAPLDADLAIMPLAATLTAAQPAEASLAPQPVAEQRQTASPAVAAVKKEAATTKVSVSAPAKVNKAAAAARAKEADSKNLVTTVTGATITPKKTIKAVASAYTASAEENGGYAGKDYFGNSLKVGSIAVDPDVIPLGSTVYVTGYNYNGLPVGGMMAKAVDIGGAIDGNRVDLFVPDSQEKAKKFGYQNVTLYVVD